MGQGRLACRSRGLRVPSSFRVFLSAVTVLGGVPQAFALEPLIASQARIIGDEARTRIVLDFAEEPESDVHYLDLPARIVVDFPAVNFAFPASDLKPTGLFRISALAAWARTAPVSC